MEIQKIPLSLVVPSPMNPRKTFDEGELQELADNIEKQGLLQPITVRPIKDEKEFAVVNGNADFHPKYEIVCGERRFRAFSKLSDKWRGMDCIAPKGETFDRFSEISAIIREMNDDEAFDAMITENLQRKDVDPMEEAFAFGQLIQKGKTAEEVAARFGKSVRFVQDRVKLNNLIPELMLAVREDKMPIVAAMIIAKLDEEEQKLYFSQYQHNHSGYTKGNAEQFINDLFMKIEKSLWYQSDDQADEDFEGGCGRKCSECNLNTANHGCLFWEMKGQDVGRCTDRSKFSDKTVAFILREIEGRMDELVKKNQPLTMGKVAVCMNNNSYLSDSAKLLKSRIATAMEERNIEIVDPVEAFSYLVSYDNDDERVAEILEEGRAYRCLSIHNHFYPELKDCHYYVKKDDTTVNSDENGTPLAAKKILDSLHDDEKSLKYQFSVAGGEALEACSPTADSISDDEMVLLLTCMLVNNYTLCNRVGIHSTSDKTSPDNLKKWVFSHRDKWSAIQLAWMFQQIAGVNAGLRAAEPILDTLGKKHCPEEYQKAMDDVNAKFNKKKAKAEKRLKKLGYGLDGKPLSNKEPETIKLPRCGDIQQQYKEMKAKHPDAILLFRVGDFYECFHEDAEKVAKTLNLTLTSNSYGKLAGFPHHALDTYLPRLVRAGLRVVICEQPDEPKKDKKRGKKKDSDFPTMEFVEKMREEYPNSLLLFHVGEYYECYDQDANDFDTVGGSKSTYEMKWGQKILVNRFHQDKRDKILAILNEAELNPQIIEEPK